MVFQPPKVWSSLSKEVTFPLIWGTGSSGLWTRVE